MAKCTLLLFLSYSLCCLSVFDSVYGVPAKAVDSAKQDVPTAPSVPDVGDEQTSVAPSTTEQPETTKKPDHHKGGAVDKVKHTKGGAPAAPVKPPVAAPKPGGLTHGLKK